MIANYMRGGMFIPDYKWGPISYMRLSHEAFRVGMKRLLSKVESLATSNDEQGLDASQVQDLLDLWKTFVLCLGKLQLQLHRLIKSSLY